MMNTVSVKKVALFMGMMVGVAVLAGGWWVWSSNLLRQGGTATFDLVGQRSVLRITGPAGWHCVEYSLRPISDGGPMVWSGSGWSKCPLTGDIEHFLTHIPPLESVEAHRQVRVPPERPVLLFRNQAGTYEHYVMLIKDKRQVDEVLKKIQQIGK